MIETGVSVLPVPSPSWRGALALYVSVNMRERGFSKRKNDGRSSTPRAGRSGSVSSTPYALPHAVGDG
jgi:hypothetical protein